MESEKHKSNIRTATTSQVLDRFMVEKSSPMALKVWAAEGTMAFHTVKHHMSYNSMNCTAPLMRTLFIDSEIAKQLSCGKTKTEAIINGVLAPRALNGVKEALSKVPFVSLSTDASNHGHHKLFPLVTQYFDYENGGIQVKLLDLKETNNEKAENVTNLIEGVLEKHNLTEKLSAFVADNAPINFGGLNRRGANNVLSLLKKKVSPNVIGVGCPAHILHNCAQHGLDQFGTFDIDVVVFKLFKHFSVYTLKTAELKDFCEFVQVQYQPLLSHSKTRWLSLFPAIERILKLFPALKSYFLSIEKPPIYLENFFLNDMAESFLFFVQSFMYIFHSRIATIEREGNSILEISSIIESVANSLRERIKLKFLPMTLLSNLERMKAEGKEKECTDFHERTIDVCKEALDYLLKWTSSLSELKVFQWLKFDSSTKEVEYNQVVQTMQYLKLKNVDIHEDKIIDQLANLNNFLNMKKNDVGGSADFFSQTSNDQMCQFFKANANIDSFSEILKIAQYFFSIPGHNANCERIFSLTNVQWSDERNRLLVENVRNIVIVQYNYKKMSCADFHKYLMKPENLAMLRAIGNFEKYDRA